MHYGSSHHAKGHLSFLQTAQWSIARVLNAAENVYLCRLAVFVLTVCVTVGAFVALQCRLTACVQVSALLNTKAFNPHKLGT